jgi:hypothetical protein
MFPAGSAVIKWGVKLEADPFLIMYCWKTPVAVISSMYVSAELFSVNQILL